MFDLIRGGPLQIGLLLRDGTGAEHQMVLSRVAKSVKGEALRSLCTKSHLGKAKPQYLPASIGASGTLVPELSESESLDAVQPSIAYCIRVSASDTGDRPQRTHVMRPNIT